MYTTRPLKTKVCITLDEDITRKIQQLADADDRNFSQYINRILKIYLEDHPDISETEERKRTAGI